MESNILPLGIFDAMLYYHNYCEKKQNKTKQNYYLLGPLLMDHV